MSALWITGAQVFYSTSSGGLWSVPLAGGAAAQIAADVTGVALVGGTLYYTADHAVGAPDSQGKQSSAPALYAVPFTGGPIDPSSAVLVADNFTVGASAQDSSSLYVAGPESGSILKLSPPNTSPTTLNFDSTLYVRALAVDDTYVYASVSDLSAQPGEGLIVRMPKEGGTTDRLTPLAGDPDGLAVDVDGLFWIQEPPPGTFGNTEIVHSDLFGQNTATLFDDSAASASDIALGPVDLYFIADGLERITKQGGAPETLTASLTGAGLLQASGSDLVWVDNFNRALSSTSPTTIEVLCAGPSTGP